jgi:hypothetical protein
LTCPARISMQDPVSTVFLPLTSYPGSDAMATDTEGPLTDYSPDGVDLTLIRWMLSLTPAERLKLFQQYVNKIIALRELNAGT